MPVAVVVIHVTHRHAYLSVQCLENKWDGFTGRSVGVTPGKRLSLLGGNEVEGSLKVMGIWRKWLDRRSAKARMTWDRFERFIMKRFPLPAPVVTHRLWGGRALRTFKQP